MIAAISPNVTTKAYKTNSKILKAAEKSLLNTESKKTNFDFKRSARKIPRIFHEIIDSLFLKKLHVYDENNKLASIIIPKFKDEKGAIYFAKEFLSQGKIKSRELFDITNGKLKERQVFNLLTKKLEQKELFNENGSFLKKIQYNECVTELMRTVTTTDENGIVKTAKYHLLTNRLIRES